MNATVDWTAQDINKLIKYHRLKPEDMVNVLNNKFSVEQILFKRQELMPKIQEYAKSADTTKLEQDELILLMLKNKDKTLTEFTANYPYTLASYTKNTIATYLAWIKAEIRGAKSSASQKFRSKVAELYEKEYNSKLPETKIEITHELTESQKYIIKTLYENRHATLASLVHSFPRLMECTTSKYALASVLTDIRNVCKNKKSKMSKLGLKYLESLRNPNQASTYKTQLKDESSQQSKVPSSASVGSKAAEDVTSDISIKPVDLEPQIDHMSSSCPDLKFGLMVNGEIKAVSTSLDYIDGAYHVYSNMPLNLELKKVKLLIEYLQ